MSTEPDDGSDMPEYKTACNLIWQSDTVVTVSMLNGATPRSLLRELLEKFQELGIEKVLAKRAEGKLLPRLFHKVGNRADDLREMDVQTALDYLNRESQFGDL